MMLDTSSVVYVILHRESQTDNSQMSIQRGSIPPGNLCTSVSNTSTQYTVHKNVKDIKYP